MEFRDHFTIFIISQDGLVNEDMSSVKNFLYNKSGLQQYFLGGQCSIFCMFRSKIVDSTTTAKVTNIIIVAHDNSSKQTSAWRVGLLKGLKVIYGTQAI